jgi:hypothetical protein
LGANLLTQAGYTTDLVVTVDRAMRRATAGRYHLAIVSTISTHNEQLAIRAHLKQVKPGVTVLLLGAEHDSPRALLESVSIFLGRSKTPDMAAQLSDDMADELAD